MMEIKKLDFDIAKFSSYSTSYLPENIRENNPSNQTSRWSSNTNSPPQFLTLKLQRPAIVKKIKFGKYEKTHVCNLRKFKVFGGLEEEHMILLFEGGLKNDSVPEVFDLRHKTNSGEFLPVKFIQIMPLLSWGPSFNFSIWYVELLGADDPSMVLASLRNFNMLREIEIVRLCLKHCRQQGYDKTFASLKEETNVYLEDEIMTDLYETLVNQGDFKKTEELMGEYVLAGLMDEYISKQEYKASWVKQNGTDGMDDRPGQRGGHQLIIDSDDDSGVMYLYGGWDGAEDLSDLWTYSIKTSKWSLIHRKSELLDGPSPRACHKMIFDPCNSQIFILGRYLDAASRTKDNLKSDFYLYDTRTNTWFLICDDTSQVGGPALIYDHQMCMDNTKKTIYVFGGRVLMCKDDDDMSNDFQYSGLFSYHISTNTWTQILVDCAHSCASDPDVLSIRSRVTHSMLFHHKQRKLYIFGGQRGKDYIMDMQTYDVDSQEICALPSENSSSPKNDSVPQPGFTQRATIDTNKNEIYVLTSRSKEKERKDMNINSFWVYSLNSNEWNCIYKSDHSTGETCYSKNSNMCAEPCPRYAHQLVYDNFNQVHYLFGGNPGVNYPQMRLDDFWALYLEKPSRNNVLRLCKYWIRRQEYEEIAKTNPLKGIQYLQTEISEIIDHKNATQLKEFHKLASLLFKSEDGPATDQENMMTISMGAFSACDDSNDKLTEISSGKCDDKQPQIIVCDIQNDSNSLISLSSTSSSSSSDFMARFKKDPAIQHNETTFNKFKYSGKKFEIKSRRSLLFNKLIEMMPEKLGQPKGNLSDFVLV